ncbi:MAG TPA: aminotransferase class I/II-fold pyridoxal phosphate-dependent enzyme [Acidimicrobiales bacterium]|nr:aminotransferase class I/II-fold pyridoxal phosphate-dependent enzyme [Acidimicrobiales bacterium]
MKRILYSGSVHDQAEKDAVMAVLDGGVTAFTIGERVAEMERQVAALFGKASGIMVNSGSSALFLAVELLDLPTGSEVITSTCTFSTDVSSIVRAGLVPVFVDVEPATYNADVARIEEMISDRTRAILLPNLIGNAPDWDAVRAVADAHDLLLVEDSCDALGATPRGAPTGTRSHISLTSFANSHIITCAGNGGMVLLDDAALRDRGLLLRRWGRRSEVQLYGSRRGERDFWEELDGVRYDNMFIFDELGWNFEPSEMGAAFGLEQLKKLPANYARRERNFALYTEFLRDHEDRVVLPRTTDGLATAWLCYPIMVRPGAGFTRSDLQQFLEQRDIDTRTVWTGNAVRQPMMKGVQFRAPAAGMPNADDVMSSAMILPMSHAIGDDGIAYVCEAIGDFFRSR